MNRPEFSAVVARLGVEGHIGDVLADAPFGVYVDHPTDGAVYANQALLDIFDVSWPEFAGFGWAQHIVAADRERMTQRIAEYEQSRTPIDVQYRVATEHGQRWVHAYVKAIVDESGHHVGSLGVVRDVTEQHTLRTDAASRQRLEAVGRLSARVAHDFNNSLAAMMMVAESFEDEPVSPNARELLGVLRLAIAQASQVTGQLLTLARQRPLSPGVCEANAEVAILSRLLRSAVGERVTLELGLCEGHCFVPLDSSQLSQIVLNLVTNGRDAISDTGTVQVRTEIRDEIWTLRVEDSGHGIPDEVVDRITEPFFTTKEVGRGTGLGLAIVRDLVELANGTLCFGAGVDGGTIVTVELPTLDHRREMAQIGRNKRDLDPLHLILVEDSDALRQALGYALALRGHHVRAAGSVSEARARLAEDERLDLFITDVLLPDGNGMDFAAELRRRRPDLPIIVVSGFVGTPSEQPDFDDGNTVFLSKPFGHPELLEAMHSVMSRSS